MKNKNISHGIAELDGRKLEIDLDNLHITFERDHFDLASIPGTKGGNRYFFICPICGNRCRKLIAIWLWIMPENTQDNTEPK